MVLESLIGPFRAERRPWEMFFIGMIYSSIAVFVGIQLFDKHAGLVAVFLTVLVCVPIIYQTLKLEESKDKQDIKERILLKEHSKALAFFMFLFMGTVISFTLWYTFLPADTVSNLFSIQIDTIKEINTHVSGNFANPTEIFPLIFLNNMKVLIFCVLFAFFYGFGAIFILTWNASVIAVAIGTYVRSNLSAVASAVGFSKLAFYLQFLSLGVLRYLIHGVFEILAYFVAGLAGGIISIAVINHDIRSKYLEKILMDTTTLILISIGILFFAAIVEVYITPLIF